MCRYVGLIAGTEMTEANGGEEKVRCVQEYACMDGGMGHNLQAIWVPPSRHGREAAGRLLLMLGARYSPRQVYRAAC